MSSFQLPVVLMSWCKHWHSPHCQSTGRLWDEQSCLVFDKTSHGRKGHLKIKWRYDCIYCILEWNIKGTVETINMLAKCLRVLQCGIRFIATAFPIQIRSETRPQCDPRFIATTTNEKCKCSFCCILAGVADSCGLHLLMILMRDRNMHIIVQ